MRFEIDFTTAPNVAGNLHLINLQWGITDIEGTLQNQQLDLEFSLASDYWSGGQLVVGSGTFLLTRQ